MPDPGSGICFFRITDISLTLVYIIFVLREGDGRREWMGSGWLQIRNRTGRVGGGGGGHGGKIDSFTEQCQVPHTGTQPFLVWHLKKKKMLALEKEKMWDNFQRIIDHFTQKIVKIWSWDPGSGRRNKPIPDPGVKKAPDPGAVLSLTVDKVIQSSLFQAPALSRDGSRAGSNSQQYQHSRQVRFFFAPRKELGKGGGSGIRVPVYLV